MRYLASVGDPSPELRLTTGQELHGEVAQIIGARELTSSSRHKSSSQSNNLNVPSFQGSLETLRVPS